MLEKLFNVQGQETEEHWVSISDVMAVLMVIFLFIAISYMVNVKRKTDDIEKLLNTYSNLQTGLSKDLREEFEGTTAKKQQFQIRWQGHLDMATLSIRFKKPFTQGDATVPNAFKNVLRDFFPRYIAILTEPEYRDSIAEIRIEGHTSSEWFNRVTGNDAYLNNMELSQDRARNVLDYVLRIPHTKVVLNKAWLRKNLTANGLSSSQLIPDFNLTRSRPVNPYNLITKETGIPLSKISQIHQWIRNWPDNKKSTREDIIVNLIIGFSEFEQKAAVLEKIVDLLMENREESRRVEFRVVTKSKELIEKIRQLTEEPDR